MKVYTPGKMMFVPLELRFWTYVDIKSESECWEWLGARGHNGYGYIGLGSRKDGIIATHRLAYLFEHGEIPHGKIVCHRCSNRPCNNPHHLFAGTYSENIAQGWAETRRKQ